MNAMNFCRPFDIKAIGTLFAILAIGSIVPAQNAQAACHIRAGRIWKFCQATDLGATKCTAFETECVVSGSGCGITLAKAGKKRAFSCASKRQVGSTKSSQTMPPASENGRTQQRNSQAEANASSDNTVMAPSQFEIDELEKLKKRVANHASKGQMPAESADYMRLFQSERRDEAWARQTESEIASELSRLPLEKLGLSQPIVRCATSVCEVEVLQDVSISENPHDNWQVLLPGLMKSKKLGLDSATLTADVGNDKVGFVSYVLADRK